MIVEPLLWTGLATSCLNLKLWCLSTYNLSHWGYCKQASNNNVEETTCVNVHLKKILFYHSDDIKTEELYNLEVNDNYLKLLRLTSIICLTWSEQQKLLSSKLPDTASEKWRLKQCVLVTTQGSSFFLLFVITCFNSNPCVSMKLQKFSQLTDLFNKLFRTK